MTTKSPPCVTRLWSETFSSEKTAQAIPQAISFFSALVLGLVPYSVTQVKG